MGRRKDLPDGAVSTDGMSGAVVAGRTQVPAGTVDMWPILRDPGAPEAVARGELDQVLVELHTMAQSHADHHLIVPIVERATKLGLNIDLGAPAPPPDPKPFSWKR